MGSRTARLILAAVFLTVAVVGGAAGGVRVAAAAERRADGKELRAREAFAAGRYEEALDLFAKLYAETLHPVYLRNIGRCHQKMRQPQPAIDSFRDYLAKSKKLSADEKAEIQGYIKEMEDLRAEQAPAQTKNPPAGDRPADGTASAGAADRGTGAGTHADDAGAGTAHAEAGGGAGTAHAEAGGGAGGAAPDLAAHPAAATREADLVGGGPPPPAPSTPVYQRWWFWTGIVVVVAGGVAATYFLTRGTDRPACVPPTMCK